MNRPQEDWPRLASYVVSARVRAGFRDRRALSAATGVTDRTLGKLENGKRVSPDTLASIELAVGWKPDSARRVLAGGEPLMQSPGRDGDSPGGEVDDEAYIQSLSPAERKIVRDYMEMVRRSVEQQAMRRTQNGA